jgi:hypothetical protein
LNDRVSMTITVKGDRAILARPAARLKEIL